MTYCNQLAVLVAALLESVHSDAEQWIEEAVAEQRDVIVDVVVKFLAQEVTPETTFDFEHSLAEE